MRRIPDWDTLDAAAQTRRREHARPQAIALDPILNAFAQIDATPFPRSAAGPLGDLPYAAKDMLRTLTHRPSGGFAERAISGLSGTAICWTGSMHGADRIGFTNMTELAYEPSGFNASRGRVKNPWSLDHVPGGSSSGSAAAVASGAVVAALGSDTGGSLRIPAHCCGITAWKPTYGVISTRGAMPLAPSLDTIGLLARSAADLLPLASDPGRAAVIASRSGHCCAPRCGCAMRDPTSESLRGSADAAAGSRERQSRSRDAGAARDRSHRSPCSDHHVRRERARRTAPASTIPPSRRSCAGAWPRDWRSRTTRWLRASTPGRA